MDGIQEADLLFKKALINQLDKINKNLETVSKHLEILADLKIKETSF